jgi:hypothetical protein
MHENLSEEQERVQGHPPSWAAIYGDQGMDVPVYGDPGPSWDPSDRSSAAKHASRVRRREQAAAQQRDLAVIARAAAEQNDDKALEQATELLRRGQEVPDHLRVRAARAARRNGTTIPTADQHAAKVRR